MNGESAPVRERVVRWADPHETAEAIRMRGGLEGLTAMLRGEIPPPPIAELMGIRIAEVEKGRVVFEGDPGEHLFNPIGVVHGGFAATILDSALGCSIHSVLPAGVGYTTTDLHVRYLRAIRGDSGRVRCEAKVAHAGRSTAVAEARLTDAEGRLLCIATTACAILRP